VDMRFYTALMLMAGCLSVVQASDIEGQIVIKRKLTRRTVTAAAGAYDRGVSVNPATGQEDPLVYERSRVVIYLDGELPGRQLNATLEQKNRRFIPDTIAVPTGSTVSFPNLDPIFHNVFSLSKPKSFDLGNYPKDHTRTVAFPKPGVVFVHCHLHPNMAAAIVVTPNQWSTKADADGRFALTGVPSGAYTIVAWHKAAGFFRQSIRVTEKRPTAVQFVIPIDEHGLNLARR
jgi:plastocyanin